MEQLQIVHDQFLLLNVPDYIKWGFGYKNEDDDENDNYTCYAFFSQDKFPEYLEKE